MRRLNNRQKAIHRRPNPIARLLPRFKPQVTRDRTKYSRKGRHAQRILQGARCAGQDAKGSKGTLPDTPAFSPRSKGSAGGPGARLRMSLRMAKRAPCAFTETALKRALQAVRAAGETPGRLVITKDGFVIEFADRSREEASHLAAGPDGGDRHPAAPVVNKWDELLRQ